MTTSRQLIAVEFSLGGRSYTYHNDLEPARVGDDVVVMTKGGPKTVRVVSINPITPTVPTKPIVGKSDRPRKPEQRPLL